MQTNNDGFVTKLLNNLISSTLSEKAESINHFIFAQISIHRNKFDSSGQKKGDDGKTKILAHEKNLIKFEDRGIAIAPVKYQINKNTRKEKHIQYVQSVARYILLLLSASPYSGSPQRESIFHFSRSTSSPSLAPTLSMSSLAKSIHLLFGLPLFLLPGTAISIIVFPT